MKITCLSRLFCRFRSFRPDQKPRGELPMRSPVAQSLTRLSLGVYSFFCFSCASLVGRVLFPRCPKVVPRYSWCCSAVVLWLSRVPPSVPAAKRHAFAANVPMSSPVFQPCRHGHRRVSVVPKLSRVLSRVVVPRLSGACECTVDGRQQAAQAYTILWSTWKLFEVCACVYSY